MTRGEFFSKVKEGDIVVLRKDLVPGERYGGMTYIQGMPKPGTALEFECVTSEIGFKAYYSYYHFSPYMVDYIVSLEKDEEVAPKKVEKLTEDFRQAREQLENIQKEFDKLKCLLEEISKNK